MGTAALRWLILLILIALGGCATPPQTRLLLDNPPELPRRVELIEVPFFPQQEYHCGPAALASVLGYRGTPVEPAQIARLIYVPELKGSLQIEVIGAARQFELLPVLLDGRLESLLRELADGNPVFVLQNLGLDSVPVWHYEVVIGYDLDAGEFILRSGEHQRILRPFALFERTWGRAGHWALSIVAADTIPATASEQAYLQAVIAMEEVGKIDSAHRGYHAAARRWPGNLLAQSGVGNTAYALGDFVAAESAFRAALAIDPGRADVWNNLAYALAQLGEYQSSTDAIRRALELDPENQNFRDSFEELSGWQ